MQSIKHLHRQNRSFLAFAKALIPFNKAVSSSSPMTFSMNSNHVKDFIIWSKGEPSHWGHQIPPTLFPYWTMPTLVPCLLGRKLALSRMLNGGCKIVQKQPLMLDDQFTVRTSLKSITQLDRFQMVSLQSETWGDGNELLLETEVRFVIPNASKQNAKGSAIDRPPQDKLLGALVAQADDGFRFACLTGDPNPIHWLTLWARLFGFKSTILHGFGTLSRSYEHMLARELLHRNTVYMNVDFRHPVPLPSIAKLYRDADRVSVWVDGSPKPSLTGTIHQ